MNTKSGPINGKKHLIDGKEVDIFLGIPYAEPPVRDLRFRKPLPVKQWTQPLDAGEWSNPCYQIDYVQDLRNMNYSEDCLYLNIWSPNMNESNKELKPVLFFIHGGAFYMGSSSQVSLDAYMLAVKGDIVVVTINYRLDAFGFMYTETDDSPGNMGLWDQVLALQWVNNNIEFFGGDPNKITISGQSAGSWSVSLHILSPVSRNLFQNAIMMSGASLNHIDDKDPELVMNDWLKGAQSVGCVDDDDSSYIKFTPKIMKCLRKADPERILRIASLSELAIPKLGWFRFVVIDGKFLTKKPLDLLRSSDYKKNVNLLIGSVEDEGSLFLNMFYNQDKYDFTSPENMTLDEAYDELEELSEYFASNIPIDGSEASELYFLGLSDDNVFDVIRSRISAALGDYYLTCPTIKFAEFLYSQDKNGTKIFQYYYTNRLIDVYCSEWMGVCHTSDMYSIFGIPLINSENSLEKEKVISRKMIGLFSHFVRHGYPEPQDGVEYPSYYSIDENVIKPFYEISKKPKPITNFGIGLKTIECNYLWKKYLES